MQDTIATCSLCDSEFEPGRPRCWLARRSTAGGLGGSSPICATCAALSDGEKMPKIRASLAKNLGGREPRLN
jgi:hypothetical protein